MLCSMADYGCQFLAGGWFPPGFGKFPDWPIYSAAVFFFKTSSFANNVQRHCADGLNAESLGRFVWLQHRMHWLLKCRYFAQAVSSERSDFFRGCFLDELSIVITVE